MKKCFYLIIISLSFSLSAVKAQGDAEAKQLLNAVTAKLKSYKGINAGFILVSKSRAGKINNSTSGKISIKGDKYYIKEGTTEIFSDGNKVWNYNGNDEVTVTDANAEDNALSPQKLLTNFYDKDFTCQLISSAGNYDQIQLVPVDKRKNFQKVNVFVDKSKMIITKAKVVDKSSNTIDFSLKNINTSAAIPDETFVFNQKKYKKNIEVIE